MSKKKELGKGIRSLLSGYEAKSPQEKATIKSEVVSTSEVDIRKIEANPDQPRSEFDPELLKELSASIKIHGIIQPITVRKIGGGNFQIISGERRWRAAKLAKLKKVPVYVREVDDKELVELAIIENIQRSDLNAIEIALSFHRLMEEFDLTHKTLSERLSKDRSTITNYLRLLKLPPIIQKALKSGSISMGHAKVLAGIAEPDAQIRLYRKIVSDNLSVRDTEADTKTRTVTKTGTSAKKINPQIKKIELGLSDKLGTKVVLNRSQSGRGKLVISFTNDGELNRILDIIDGQ